VTTTWVDPTDPLAPLPKVSLHDHLDGSLRPETILELAAASGKRVPRTDPDALQYWLTHFAEEEPGGDWELPFGLSTSVMQTPEQLRRVAREYVETAVADGVVYAETRWAPEKHLAGGLSMDEAVAAVAEGLEAGMAAARAGGRFIEVRQLLSIMRTSDRDAEVLATALRNRDAGVVGVDLAGHEEGHPAHLHAAAFEGARAAGLRRTVHAGEADGVASIRDALETCHAERIGHGARLAEDLTIDGRLYPVREVVAAWERAGKDGSRVTLGAVSEGVRASGTVLELCPTSNCGGVVDVIEQHPIDLLAALGVAVSVNIDNRMLTASSVTGQMRILVDVFGWTPAQLRTATLAGARAAFGPADLLDEIITEQILPGWAD
jgi:adenosine deaminase